MAPPHNGNNRSSNLASSATSVSLLMRVQADDSDAWSRLVRLYGPVIYEWARHAGLQPDDAADVAQDVFRSLTAHIARFSREQPAATFRGWLWTVTRNCICDYYRAARRQARAVGGTEARDRLEQLAEAPPDPLSESGRLELGNVRRRALQLVRQEFDDRTWTAFWRTAVENDRPAEVADDLGISVWAVYKAKSRVLQRLRCELEGLLD